MSAVVMVYGRGGGKCRRFAVERSPARLPRCCGGGGVIIIIARRCMRPPARLRTEHEPFTGTDTVGRAGGWRRRCET